MINISNEWYLGCSKGGIKYQRKEATSVPFVKRNLNGHIKGASHYLGSNLSSTDLYCHIIFMHKVKLEVYVI